MNNPDQLPVRLPVASIDPFREDVRVTQRRGDLAGIHRTLRGRYRWGVPLTAMLAAAGIVIGFKIGHRTYQSTGLIRVMPVVPQLSTGGGDSGVMPMFETFMDAQVSLLRSQRVIDNAMQDPTWQALGRGRSDEAAVLFARNLDVSRQGEMLAIRATDRDPQAATAGVQTVIAAYQRIYEERDARSGEKVEGVLLANQSNLQADLDAVRKRIAAVAEEYGPEGLQSESQFRLAELDKIESDIGKAERMLAGTGGDPATRPASVRAAAADDLTPEAIALTDTRMAQYLVERDSAAKRVAAMRAHDVMEGHPALREAEAMLNLADETVQDYAERYRGLAVDPRDGTPRVSGPFALRERVAALTALQKKARDALAAVSARLAQISELKTRAERIELELEQTRKRLDELHVEGKIAGRLEVMSDADRPLEAYRDTRPMFAGTGGLAGLLCGLGTLLAIGTMDRRLRHSDEVALPTGNCPILGLVPELPQDLFDPQQAALAAHSVHCIRTLLQLWTKDRKHRAIAVTSPAPGSGKTSLTLALGASFASAGFRVLVIDFDLVGGGLTTRVHANIRRKLGQILRRGGQISDGQLEQALTLARGSRRRLGEELVELGYMTADDVATAVRLQENDEVGILDVMGGEPMGDCLCPAASGIDRLSVLPRGSAGQWDAPSLSPEAVGRIIDEARRKFDVILLDTGPILGSLEARVVASEADAVILTVARGEQRPRVEKAVACLRAVKATLGGVVFNRARGQDLNVFETGSSSSPRGSRGAVAVAPDSNADLSFRRLDPLVRAVTSSLPGRTRVISDSQPDPDGTGGGR